MSWSRSPARHAANASSGVALAWRRAAHAELVGVHVRTRRRARRARRGTARAPSPAPRRARRPLRRDHGGRRSRRARSLRAGGERDAVVARLVTTFSLGGAHEGLRDQPGHSHGGADQHSRVLRRGARHLLGDRCASALDARLAIRSSRSTTIAWLCAFVGHSADGARRSRRSATQWVCRARCSCCCLGPLAVALLGGLFPALAASVVAFLLADWYFIVPTHSLRFRHAGDAAALLVFVAVSVLVSGLVDRLARRSAELARGQAETEALAELATGTATLDSEAVERLVNELRLTLDLDAVAVLAPTVDGFEVVASSGEPVPSAPEGWYVLGRAREWVTARRVGARARRRRPAAARRVRRTPAARADVAATPGRGGVGLGPHRRQQRARRAARTRCPTTSARPSPTSRPRRRAS